MKKTIKLIGIITGVIALLAVALVFWKNSVIEGRNLAALQQVEELLDAQSSREALVLINARPAGGNSEEMDQRWLAVEVEACAQLGLIARLQTLLSMAPSLTLSNENAALILARAYLHGGEIDKGLDIAHSWQAKSDRPHLWFAYIVDTELFQGKRDQAYQLLSSKHFDGPGDSVRLARLALLSSREDPTTSWNLLADAYVADPKDTDVRSFRGQILETLGSNQLARVEYVAAHVASPQNFVLRDQLAEFYRRQGSFLNAQDTWAPALTNRPPAFLPLKASFWSRVARPVELPEFDLSDQDPLSSLVNYMTGLPEDQFWDESSFKQLKRYRIFESQRQELYWLKLLEACRNNDLETATQMVRSNPFRSRVFDPTLDRALAAWLSWKETGLLDAYGINLEQIRISPTRHSFLTSISEQMKLEKKNRSAFQLSSDLKAVFESESAAGLIFLTAGWLNAGLDLIGAQDWDPAMPSWIPYSVTQAKRTVEGPDMALEYAKRQPPSDELELVIAELLLSQGQLDEGLLKLEELHQLPNAVGYRAAWLLSADTLKKGNHARLQTILSNQPLLQEKPAGQELLAKSAIMQGATNQAEVIYKKIVADSIEAKAYLASLAFQQKDYAKARELTELLILTLPDELSLRDNLEQIAQAESEAEAEKK